MNITIAKESRFLADIVYKECQLLFDMNIQQDYPLGKFLFVELHKWPAGTANRWYHSLSIPAHKIGINYYERRLVNFSCKESLINNLSLQNINIFIEKLHD